MTTHTFCMFLAFVLPSFFLGGCKGASSADPAAIGPVEVEVVTLKPQLVELMVELPGRTAAFRIAEVRPQVTGIVQKRLFVEGAVVKAGALLYQIDPATYQAGFESAKATLAKAEAIEHASRLKADRYRNLLRTQAVSEQDQVEMEASWKQAVAEVAAAKAALATARINLDYTRVTAPISGRIGKSAVTEGALVTAQQNGALATIQQLDPLFVDVSQSSSELLHLKKELAAGVADPTSRAASTVQVLLEDGSAYTQAGRLEFSDVTVNQTTGTVILRALVANPEQELLPGMFVRARISKGQQSEVLLVPAASMSRNSKGQALVMVVNSQSQVEARLVQAGQNHGQQVLVSQGLQAGEQVIVTGLQKIKPGMAVTTMEQVSLETDRTAATAGPAGRME